MQKERFELLKAYLKEVALDNAKAVAAIKLWKEGNFKEFLKEADFEDATVEDIKAIVKSGEVDTTILEQANGACDDIDVPTSMGNCVA